MTFGEKIKKLRTEANLTQKDLAEKLNVSFQTVSKYENDTNEPDLQTIKKLAQLFNCSIDYLFSDKVEEDVTTTNDKNNKEEESIPTQTLPVVLAKCVECGKEITDYSDLHNISRKTGMGIVENVAICDDCLAKHHELDKRRDELAKRMKSSSTQSRVSLEKNTLLTFSIIGGVVAFIVALILSIVYFDSNNVGPSIAVAILVPIFSSYTIFATIFCIFSYSYIGEIFESIASWSIRMPGVIFTLDFEGVAFLIVVKIFLAILSFALSVFVFLLAVAVSAFFSIFSFPFIFPKEMKRTF